MIGTATLLALTCLGIYGLLLPDHPVFTLDPEQMPIGPIITDGVAA